MTFEFNGEKYLSVKDLNKVLPIHPKTLSKMLKLGEIPGAGKIGKQWYLPEGKLDEYFQTLFKS